MAITHSSSSSSYLIYSLCVVVVIVVVHSLSSTHLAECSTLPGGASVDQFTTHDVTFIEFYSTLTGDRLNNTMIDRESSITVRFTAFNETFELLLQLKSMMFSSSYVEKYFSNGKGYHRNPVTDQCYYSGVVSDEEQGSTVAASTCYGFTAYITTLNETYHVEPKSSDIDGEHYVFRDSDNISPPTHCDVTGKRDQFVKYLIANRVKRSLNWPQDLDGTTRVIELYIVNSYSQFLSQGSNRDAVYARTKNIINVVNSLYQSQRIYAVLVGIEVWTTTERITIDYSNSTATLLNFLKYRNTTINPLSYNDNAQLITNQQFSGGVVGKAPVGAMCSYGSSGGINSDIRSIASYVGTSMAHELGHNFGLLHDTDIFGCVCNDPSNNGCIMSPYTSSSSPYTSWSSCSISAFQYALTHGLDYCLKNIPKILFNSTSYCGNGIVENGEQCDCGNNPLTSECNSACCNPTTCQLIGSATCASGRCCDITSCQLRSRGYECRPSNGQCDLSEYCNGTVSVCPSDIYKRDSTSCNVNGETAYCYQGECQSQQTQCQLLWGSQSSASDPQCYGAFNTYGDFAGNCGLNLNNFTYNRCASSDVMCGQLLCSSTGSSLANFESLAIIFGTASIRSFICNSVIIDAGTQRQSPSLVPNGAPCGTDKMCLSQRCVAVSSLTTQFPSCPNNCYGNGVCNSLGLCHCNPGYSPSTNCQFAQAGCGGSVPSGSPAVCTSSSSSSSSTTLTTTLSTVRPSSPSTTQPLLPSSNYTILLPTVRPSSSSTTQPLLPSSNYTILLPTDQPFSFSSSQPRLIMCYEGQYVGTFTPNAVKRTSGCGACQSSSTITGVGPFGNQVRTYVLSCVSSCSEWSSTTNNPSLSTECCSTSLCNEATKRIVSRAGLLLTIIIAIVLTLH